jgi:endonuclease/exonuclease/phosphatase family metal-dependent hydrolase
MAAQATLRVATFNLENLDFERAQARLLADRAGALRPQLERIAADILCLQEVNGQRLKGEADRSLHALDDLLRGLVYDGFNRVSSLGPHGHGAANVHNLVLLSRWPIVEWGEIRHAYIQPPSHMPRTASPSGGTPLQLPFDWPLLYAAIDVPGLGRLDVVNAHLKAPVAAPIEGQKLSRQVWRSVSGWAEGFYVSALRRTAQALELRLFIDTLFDKDPAARILVCGDLNAEDFETPLKILIGAEEDTGNHLLARRSLAVLDRRLPEDSRFSVSYGGRRLMLDHLLASRALLPLVAGVEVQNETLEQGRAYADSSRSDHAPLLVELDLGAAGGLR